MASTFDVTAATFDRYRALPVGVAEAILKTVRDSVGAQLSAGVLDLGAGTGRIGKAFVQADGRYVGVDLSLPMLQEFRAQSAAAWLVQADGHRLPFRHGTFGLVLLMQVLSGAHDWQSLLCEVVRVLEPGGAVVVGRTIVPSTGVDAQLKQQLAIVLEQMGISPHMGGISRMKKRCHGSNTLLCPSAPHDRSVVDGRAKPARIPYSPPHRSPVCRIANCRARGSVNNTHCLGGGEIRLARYTVFGRAQFCSRYLRVLPRISAVERRLHSLIGTRSSDPGADCDCWLILYD